MHFIGYHGTSETSALQILSGGIERKFLPETGQIGPGFYVARINGELPQWGAEQATARGRNNLPWFARMISRLTGDANNPIFDDSARRTILKIYAVRPLNKCKWNVMNEGDLLFAKAVRDDKVRHGETDAQYINPKEDYKWLQMVVPFEELQFLIAKRDDGVFEKPEFWYRRSSSLPSGSAFDSRPNHR